MDLKDAPEEAAFRDEVREFIGRYGHEARAAIQEAIAAGNDEAGEVGGIGYPPAEVRSRIEGWRRALVERNWVAPAWPKEYGGAGMSVIQQFVLNEELAEHGLPNVGGFGAAMIGPTLIVHGSEEQKKEHLSRILQGEVVWCQGWSEPSAGSDLAAVQTRAVRQGDDYVVNGQKIWTSGAQNADWMYFLVRTDPDAPKHRGISLLMTPVRIPGITVRPLMTMPDKAPFNEVFFEDVRVPVKNCIGDENRGWYVGMTLTDFERSGIGSAVGLQRRLQRVLDQANGGPGAVGPDRRTIWRLSFADRWIEAEIARLFSYRVVTIQSRNMVPNYEASVAKVFSSELGQRLAATTLKLFGLHGMLWDRRRPEALGGSAAASYMQAVTSTIAGGTSEVQRNIIATRGLGLPR